VNLLNCCNREKYISGLKVSGLIFWRIVVTATHPGVDQMLAASNSTYRTDSEANRDGRGNPHGEVYCHYTDLTVHDVPSGAFFLF